MKPAYLKSLIPALLLVVPGVTQAQLINGDFETGDFTGWTLFNDPNGGVGGAQVTLFDTAGTGVPSHSAQFEVGETSGGIGGGGLGRGGGILQDVVLNAGQLTIVLKIAVQSTAGNNADAGTFELLLDGTVVNSHGFGFINPFQTERSSLGFIGTVTAGTHEIAVDMRRGYGIGAGDTPYQYLDNIELRGSAVPEPSTALLLSFGLAALALGIRYRQTN